MVLTGQLLVATPMLTDPNFSRTVVLMLDHSEEGAVGVVLNRPSATTVAEALPAWGGRAAAPGVVFVGGPVNPTSAICLAGVAPEPAGVVSTGPGVRRLWGGLGTVDLSLDPDELAPIDWLRVFAGYAGWGAGQLEGEIGEGAWFVVDAQTADPMSPDPSGLWRAVLRRQTGALRDVANFPADPSLN
jgi:putative transcriptional regulator